MTLVVITSQLAGCATMSSDKTLKSMQESPDVSAEHATPGAGDLQYMADSDSDAGLIEDQNNQKLMEKSTLATAAKSNTTSSRGSWIYQLPLFII